MRVITRSRVRPARPAMRSILRMKTPLLGKEREREWKPPVLGKERERKTPLLGCSRPARAGARLGPVPVGPRAALLTIHIHTRMPSTPIHV